MVVNVVIGSYILLQTLSTMVLKSSSCNSDWYVDLESLAFFLGELPMYIVLGLFSPSVTFPLSFSFSLSFS